MGYERSVNLESRLWLCRFFQKLNKTHSYPDPLLICTGFLKYPFGHLFQTEIKIDFKTNWNFFPVQTGFLLPVYSTKIKLELKWDFHILKLKILKSKNYPVTLDISKNQWRSTGGYNEIERYKTNIWKKTKKKLKILKVCNFLMVKVKFLRKKHPN